MKKFESSRLTEGNKVFPTQLIVSNRGVIVKKPGLFSSEEKMVPYPQVTYVNISTPLVGFSSIEIGTENQPIIIGGFTRSEVKEMKGLILDKI